MIKKNTSNKIAIISTLAGIGSGVGIGYLAFNGDKNSQELKQTSEELKRVTNEMDHYSRKFHDKIQENKSNLLESPLFKLLSKNIEEKRKMLIDEIKISKDNNSRRLEDIDNLQKELDELTDTLKILEDNNFKLREDKKALTDRIFKLEKELERSKNSITEWKTKAIDIITQLQINRKLEEDLNNKLTEQIKSLTDKVNKFEAVKRCMEDEGQIKLINEKNQKIDWTYCKIEWVNN